MKTEVASVSLIQKVRMIIHFRIAEKYEAERKNDFT